MKSINVVYLVSFLFFWITYSGLPPSPPSNVYGIDVKPYSGHDNNGTIMKPLGVDISRKQKEVSGGRVVIVIILSSFTAFVLFIGFAWLFLLKCGSCNLEPEHILDAKIPSSSKQSGNLKVLILSKSGKLLFSIISLNN